MALALDELWVREPRLLVPRQKPIGQVRYASDAPYADKLKAIIIPNGSMMGFIDKKPARYLLGGTAALVGSAIGQGLYSSGTNNFCYATEYSHPTDAKNCSFVVVGMSSLAATQYYYGSGFASSYYAGFWIRGATSGSLEACYGANGGVTWEASTGARGFASPAGSIVANVPFVFSGSITGADAAQLFVNGNEVPVTYSGQATSYSPATYASTRIGVYRFNNAFYWGNQTLFAAMIFDTALPSALLQSLSANPYQFLIPA